MFFFNADSEVIKGKFWLNVFFLINLKQFLILDTQKLD